MRDLAFTSQIDSVRGSFPKYIEKLLTKRLRINFMPLKTQIIIQAETFQEACRALSILAGRDPEDDTLEQQLRSRAAVAISDDFAVWLQEAE